MPIDHSLEVRKAIVAHLKAASNVAAIVGDRVYGEEPPSNPVWPFVRYGFPITSPYEAVCWDGSEHTITLHTFARGPGTDNVSELSAAVVAALSDASLPLPGGIGLVGISWTGSQIVRDTPEASNYHGILTFLAQTFEEE